MECLAGDYARILVRFDVLVRKVRLVHMTALLARWHVNQVGADTVVPLVLVVLCGASYEVVVGCFVGVDVELALQILRLLHRLHREIFQFIRVG